MFAFAHSERSDLACGIGHGLPVVNPPLESVTWDRLPLLATHSRIGHLNPPGGWIRVTDQECVGLVVFQNGDMPQSETGPDRFSRYVIFLHLTKMQAFWFLRFCKPTMAWAMA
jgi:hypothetical protein